MIYYVDDFADTVKFYNGLLKENGRLMIVVEAGKFVSVLAEASSALLRHRSSSVSSPLLENGGLETLWKTYYDELCVGPITKYCSARDIKALLKSLGFQYQEHHIPNTMDIRECFQPDSECGKQLLAVFTEKNFYEWFNPEVRAGILDLLRSISTIMADGGIILNCDLSCIIVQASDRLWNVFSLSFSFVLVFFSHIKHTFDILLQYFDEINESLSWWCLSYLRWWTKFKLQ